MQQIVEGSFICRIGMLAIVLRKLMRKHKHRGKAQKKNDRPSLTKD